MVVAGVCASGLVILSANVRTLHNPSKPSYLRTRMMSGAASPSPARPSSPASLTAVRGLSVGHWTDLARATGCTVVLAPEGGMRERSEEHTSELQSRPHLVCRL